ncbi:hypothetical protein T492DRAFT_614039 [Pavlovales sp. CCMP2436]|nr:hypothetical protein T492DRAFT_614039 [Pavlovales sp. CCMP2436]
MEHSIQRAEHEALHAERLVCERAEHLLAFRGAPPSDAPVWAKGEAPAAVEEGANASERCPASDASALPPGLQRGLLMQYALIGLLLAALPGTAYAIFIGYLSTPGYVFASLQTAIFLPWSFKFAMAALSDTCPIFGQRRKPYVCIGWALAAAFLLRLAARPLPPPYWCLAPDGHYIMKRAIGGGGAGGRNGRALPAEPCHPESALLGGAVAVSLMLAMAGAVLADVAADGLLVELAQIEPPHERGALQTSCYLARALGACAGAVLTGFCLNSFAYGGSWAWGLSFGQFAALLALLCALMAAAAPLLLHEPSNPFAPPRCVAVLCGMPPVEGRKHVPSAAEVSLKAYGIAAWRLLCSRACLYVVLYQLLSGVIGGIGSPARALVKARWTHVQPVHDQLASALGSIVFALGLHVVRTRFMHLSWRRVIALTTVGLLCTDAVVQVLVIYGIARTPWLYIGEVLVLEIPMAMNFMASAFILVEMATPGLEGITYGVLSTASNLAGPIARALSNQVFGGWTPSLSDPANFISDADDFRTLVFYSYALGYACSLLALATLPLLPAQREETRWRLANWPSSGRNGAAALTLLLGGLTYALIGDFATISTRFACTRFAGGHGCARVEV